MSNVLTFKNLQDRVLRYLDEAGDTSTTLDLVKDALNAANTLRVTQEKWPFMLWNEPVTFSTVAAQRAYALHPEYHRPFYFYNRTQLDYMSQVDEKTLAPSGIDFNNDTGGALRFALWNRAAVAAQPSAASTLTVTSSNSGDTGSKSVIVRGDTADGVTTETITAGSTGTVSFTNILKVTKVGTWSGTMTLATSGGTTLLKLFASEAGRSYQTIRMLVSPDAVETIEYLFYRQPSALSNDDDLPDIPTPYELLLVYDALLYFASYNQYDAGTVKNWLNEQQKWLTALQQAYSDDRAVEAQVGYTSYIPR